MDNILYEGKWWLPEFSENKIVWFLIKDDWVFTLDLHWHLKEEQNKFKSLLWWWGYKKAFINWVTKGGEKISLYWYINIRSSSNIAWDWYDTEAYRVYHIFYWIHIEKESDINIKKISFTFDWLFEWIWEWRVNFEMTKYNDKKYYSKWILDIWDDNIINIWKVNNNFSIEFEKEYSLKSNDVFFDKLENRHRIFKSLTLDQYSRIVLSYKIVSSFEDVLSDIENIRKLYSLIIWKSIYLTDFLSKIWKKNNIELSFDKSIIKGKGDNEKGNILFNYCDLWKDNLNKIFKKWFWCTEKYKLIFNIYFSTIENKWLHLENYFLNLIQTLEWYYYIKFWREWKIILHDKIKKISENIDYVIWDKKYIVTCRNILSHWDDRSKIYENMNRFYHKTLELKLLLELSIIKDLVNDRDLFYKIKKHRREKMIYEVKSFS